MPAAGRNSTSRRRGPRALSSRHFLRLAVFFAAFALFAQLIAPPHAASPYAGQDTAGVVATLKATFGGGAVLCAHADDKASTTSPERRRDRCDENCPLCGFAAQAVLFVAPAPSLPERLDIGAASLTARAEFGGRKPRPIGFAHARAPPLEA